MFATKKWVKKAFVGRTEYINDSCAADKAQLVECHKCGCVIYKKDENKGPSEIRYGANQEGEIGYEMHGDSTTYYIKFGDIGDARTKGEYIHNDYYCKLHNPKNKRKGKK